MAGPLRIAVIADSHDRLAPSLLDVIREADEIWHLGDVCEKATLRTIQELGPKVFVVRGNQDNQPGWPMSLELERFGHRFHLVHIPPQHAPSGAEFLLHGHTHVPRDQKVEGTRFLNPGPAGLANKGAPRSFAWLDLAERKEPTFRLAAVL